MATVKKGILTRAGEWWKHLRPFGKREFWKGERKAAKRDIKFDTSCGCVFCDLGLEPEGGYHTVSRYQEFPDGWTRDRLVLCHRAD